MTNLPLLAPTRRFLVFERGAHSVVHFVQAETATEAIWLFIANQSDTAVRQADGSIEDDGIVYPHPIAYIEAIYKSRAEWQIRALPDWAWQDPFNEIFCGESEDDPAEVINNCRQKLRQEFPRSQAKGFVWYVEGRRTLVTFYRRRGPWQITVLKRYRYIWGGQTETIDEWDGTYDELAEMIVFPPTRWPWPLRK